MPGPDELFPQPGAHDPVPPQRRIHEALAELGVGPSGDRLGSRVVVELELRQVTFLAGLLERTHRAGACFEPADTPA
ncbi:hypothetical protein [Streptomyces sp. NRRL B-1347]|uniref:hypothetical protein n=1 Tax=Streptomyces sp. NRRL B-1347 TaxID=1476877 RepID=UPI00131A690B|nr:hypothetical protein [Streptomyces sp. NRRL B-1347]